MNTLSTNAAGTDQHRRSGNEPNVRYFSATAAPALRRQVRQCLAEGRVFDAARATMKARLPLTMCWEEAFQIGVTVPLLARIEVERAIAMDLKS